MKIHSFLIALILLSFTNAPYTHAAQSQILDVNNITAREQQSSDSKVGWWTSQSKENKLLYTNLTAATAIGIWGLSTWDYGSTQLHTADEGWFENDSKYGGADKLGHFWATYAFSDALTSLYKSWGYDSFKASTSAALSAWTVQFFMEVGDSTSETQGFDWGDMAMNSIGALTSVLLEYYPELNRKIDLRVEYVFNVPVEGIFDDYSNMYYSLILKLDGFDAFQDSFLKWVEISGGYYTRGYEDHNEDSIRSLFAGISINLSRLFYKNGWKKTGKTLEYIQLPYTTLKASHDLDSAHR